MDAEVRQALERDRLVDITTIGRRTGKPWRKEGAWVLPKEGRKEGRELCMK